MAAYVFLIIWLISHLICLYIAKIKNIKPTLLMRLFAVLLGPLAIPFVFFMNKNKNN